MLTCFRKKTLRKKSQTERTTFEKEIASLKLQKESQPNKKLDELRKQNTDLQVQIDADAKKVIEMTTKYEQLEEQHVLIKAQLTSDKESLQTVNGTLKAKNRTLESELERFKRDNVDLSRKIIDVQTKCKDFESKSSQNAVVVHEKNRLLASLQEKNHQYELLVSENEMNKDLSDQLKKEVTKSIPTTTTKLNVFFFFIFLLVVCAVDFILFFIRSFFRCHFI